MEKLKELKKGDVFYHATREHVIKYEYLMLYPFNNPENMKLEGYHLIINRSTDTPIRIYYTKLMDILNQDCKTYEEAKVQHIHMIESWLNICKKSYIR